jgi:acyl dehydratase
VPVGSRVRAHFVLAKIERIDDTQRQLIYNVTVEIEGRDKPALVAEWLTRIVM